MTTLVDSGGATAGRRRNGTEFPVHVALSKTAHRGDVHFTCIVRDMTEYKQAAEALAATNRRLEANVAELEERNRTISLLGEMGDLLQAAITRGEAHAIVSSFAAKILPGYRGAVGAIDAETGLVEMVATWGDIAAIGERSFPVDSCWALRNGRTHIVSGPEAGVVCAHVGAIPTGGYLCSPLLAQGRVLGLLHIQRPPGATPIDLEPTFEVTTRLVETLSNQISLALFNIELKETLRRQALRDALTGLLNRRSLEETLGRELHRAQRNGSPLAVLMLDLDHFKEFNDVNSHVAGDALLKDFSAYVSSQIRAEDFAFRFGGEEFIIILPNTRLDRALARAEQIRLGTREREIGFRGQRLSGVSVSIGIAAHPDHGVTSEALLRVADAALYTAKAEGRNRTCIAPTT
jgi:diguanylate cyclase (GGDEF)-like protein